MVSTWKFHRSSARSIAFIVRLLPKSLGSVTVENVGEVAGNNNR